MKTSSPPAPVEPGTPGDGGLPEETAIRDVQSQPRAGSAAGWRLLQAMCLSGNLEGGGVLGLIEADLAAAGEPEAGQEPPPLLVDRGAGDVLRRQRPDGRLHVVTGEEELVPAVLRRRVESRL